MICSSVTDGCSNSVDFYNIEFKYLTHVKATGTKMGQLLDNFFQAVI